MPLDLKTFFAQIVDAEDQVLFEEALKCAGADALRAAYVMVWIACAESLKRRFQEASKRDAAAGVVVGEVTKREADHKAVDRYLLEQAKAYGFISDSSFTELLHVYEMRCVYGHPYEAAPAATAVTHAAATVVQHVLSQPLRLREGFLQRQIDYLVSDPLYLDDFEATVSAFATELGPRIDADLYPWFIEKYCARIEPIVDDPVQALFVRRGEWFLTRLITDVGGSIQTAPDWHDFCRKYPKMSGLTLTTPDVFGTVGERAQDALVGAVLDHSLVCPGVLHVLQRLVIAKALTERQTARLMALLDSWARTITGAEAIRASKLRPVICSRQIITALKYHDWYIQNPVAELVAEHGPDGVAELTAEQQEELGRNILQSADGNAKSSRLLLQKAAKSPLAWPPAFLRGVLLECFVNERGEVRLMLKGLQWAIEALDHLDPATQAGILRAVGSGIAGGRPKHGPLSPREKAEAVTALSVLAAARPAVSELAALRDAVGALPEVTF